MTNDPSMTITSTIPAPEGSDSTSREGKTIPLPVTEGSNAPPAPDAPPALVQKIGNTTYEVSFVTVCLIKVQTLQRLGSTAPIRTCFPLNANPYF